MLVGVKAGGLVALFVLASVGLASVVTEVQLLIAFIGALVLASLLLARARVRSRLGVSRPEAHKDKQRKNPPSAAK